MLALSPQQIERAMSSPSTKNIYICFPMMSTPTEDPKKPRNTFLSDLGKATKRGIKKCHNCGMYNGTRGIMCKNKQCNMVFKDGSEKRKPNLEAIKLISSATRKVYSVRVRDRGPEHRGFVQLPQSDDAKKEQNTPQIALCFVDSCQRLFDVSILKCHEAEPSTNPTCAHIEAALKSTTTGIAIKFKAELLDLLNVGEDVKEKLWLFRNQTEEPFVQRVSKQVMVVRCQVTPKHPLGYLHFTFFTSRGKEGYDKWFCGCSEVTRNDAIETRKKCIHYYITLCALASDTSVSNEFLYFINSELNLAHQSSPQNRHPSAATKNTSESTSTNAVNLSLIKQADFEKISWSFMDWLSSVTECMNQKLTFQLAKRKEELVFHIPEKFFHLLKERISCHYSKVEIINPPVEPHGSCMGCYLYKYTWDVTDIFNVKQIFDTSLMQVQTSKLYVINTIQEGSEEYETLCIVKLEVNSKTSILEEYCPFLIEWIPNMGSVTEFGQLRLEFTIDYKLNNTHEKRKQFVNLRVLNK